MENEYQINRNNQKKKSAKKSSFQLMWLKLINPTSEMITLVAIEKKIERNVNMKANERLGLLRSNQLHVQSRFPCRAAGPYQPVFRRPQPAD